METQALKELTDRLVKYYKTTENIDEPTDRLVKYYKSGTDDDLRRKIGDDWRLLTVHIVRELAKGEPVEPARLAELTKWPAGKVTNMLEEGAAERDDQGRVVGYGLSLTPTDHTFEVNGRTLWAWCAPDTLFLTPILGLPARITSPCAVTGEPIEIDLTPDAIKKVSPESAVVSIVTPKLDQLADARQLVCGPQLFFKSAEVAKEWQEKHPGALIVPVADSFPMFKQLAKEVWGA